MALSPRDTEHIFQQLRGGTTPTRGLEAFAVGIDRQRAELTRMLDHVAHGEGAFKFLRGGYGCGKTLVARLAALDAHERGFATSFVVVSVNDLRFHNFADVYSCPAVSVSKTRMYLSVVAMSAWPSQHAHLLERAVRW